MVSGASWSEGITFSPALARAAPRRANCSANPYEALVLCPHAGRASVQREFSRLKNEYGLKSPWA